MKILIIIAFFLMSAASTNAHSGRTDSSGGHNCYVGACAGTYHYHNGGSYVAPPITQVAPIATPEPLTVKASTNSDYNTRLNKYSIKFDWDDVPYSQGYSVSLTKYPGSDPGPLIDTKRSVWRFNLLSAGTWYANLKSFDGSSWSSVAYWPVNLPTKQKTILKPVITPTPKPTSQPYTCSCSKTCTQISSCTEAYYQLNTCGCSVRDGDNDGVPCENLCR